MLSRLEGVRAIRDAVRWIPAGGTDERSNHLCACGCRSQKQNGP
jgi:hypothetical protein